MKALLSKFTKLSLVAVGTFSAVFLLYALAKDRFDRYVDERSTILNVDIGTIPDAGTSKLGTYKPKAVVVTSLNESRVVRLLGEITEDTAKQVVKDLARLNQESHSRITMVIDSPGGSVVDGAQIIGAIQASQAKVDTVCVSLCASMAAMIHSYGDQRLIFAHAILMYHPAYGGMMDDVDRMASRLTMIQRYIAKMEMNIAHRAGITYEEYKNRSATQIWIDGEDAVASKFADAVVFYKGDTINSIYGQITEQNKKANQERVNRKLRIFLKSAFDFLSTYFHADTNSDEYLRENFRN